MVVIGSDHGGLELKAAISEGLRQRGLEVVDLGTDNGDSVDYPDFAEKVAGAVSRGEAAFGVLLCGTGIGMSIVANKFPGVRAALVADIEGARLSREHNDANILVLSGAKTAPQLAQAIVDTWLSTEFAGGRHQRRVDKISQVEQDINGRSNGQSKPD